MNKFCVIAVYGEDVSILVVPPDVETLPRAARFAQNVYIASNMAVVDCAGTFTVVREDDEDVTI